MHLLFIGSGFVGSTTAAAMAEFGHDVLVFDIDPHKISELGSFDKKRIDACLFENGLADLLIKNRARILFTRAYADVARALDAVDAIFLCVPTPHREDGSTNMSYYEAALAQLADALRHRQKGTQRNAIVLINKSTVPIDTPRYAMQALADHAVRNVSVVSNPEFLVEGRAIEGNLTPSRIVVGASSKKDFATMRRIYYRFADTKNIPYIETNPFEAAAGKLLANYLLFSRLMLCYDVMGRVTEQFADVSFEQVRTIVCSDPRIGFWGFYDSLYAGGSCLEKDAKSLAFQLEGTRANTDMIQVSIDANHRQFEGFLARIKKDAKMSLAGKKVAILGMAFKRDTNDMRNAAGPMVLSWLARQKPASVQVYDPAIAAQAIAELPAAKKLSVTVAKKVGDAVAGADVVFVLTDWPEFETLGRRIARQATRPSLLIDGRRMLRADYATLRKNGVAVLAVGGPFLPANQPDGKVK